MSVYFPNSTSLSLGNLSAIYTPTARTWMARVKIGTTGLTAHYIWAASGAIEPWTFYYDDVNNRVYFSRKCQGGVPDVDGLWYVSADLDDGAYHHVAVTYDEAVWASGDPIIYVDGAAPSLTEVYASDGAIQSDNAATFYLGGISTTASRSYITIGDARIYSRILSAIEISSIAKSRIGVAHEKNIILQHMLNSFPGKQIYDGASITSAGTFKDKLTGLIPATPVGTITGVGDVSMAVAGA